jgi:magnesium chelatase family protein
VLFLDELPEFNTGALEIVRHAVRTGEASVCRSDGCVRLPARFQLVAAANPCPCGHRGDPRRPCGCTDKAVERYKVRLRFPLGDVLDIRVRVRPVGLEPADDASPGMATVKERVAAARTRQEDRARRLGLDARVNAALTESDIRRLLPPSAGARRLVNESAETGGVAPTMALRVLRVALTIADLAKADDVLEEHLAEAVELVDPDGPGFRVPSTP